MWNVNSQSLIGAYGSVCVCVEGSKRTSFQDLGDQFWPSDERMNKCVRNLDKNTVDKIAIWYQAKHILWSIYEQDKFTWLLF